MTTTDKGWQYVPVEPMAGGELIRCDVTGNPWGTDTRMIGRPCLCQGCRAGVRILELEAMLAAARQLGISRQTLYRKLAARAH